MSQENAWGVGSVICGEQGRYLSELWGAFHSSLPGLGSTPAVGLIRSRRHSGCSQRSEPGSRKAQAGGGVEETTPADQPGRIGSTPVPRLTGKVQSVHGGTLGLSERSPQGGRSRLI